MYSTFLICETGSLTVIILDRIISQGLCICPPFRSGTRSVLTTSSSLRLEAPVWRSLYSHIVQVALWSILTLLDNVVVCFSLFIYFLNFSSVTSISPSWSPTVLNVRTVPANLEGLGMASSLMSSGQVLLTGGSSRGGRGTVTRILLRSQEGWRAISVEPSVDLSEATVFNAQKVRTSFD